MQKQSSSYGWVVTICGTGINLALGALYAWSVFKTAYLCKLAKEACEIGAGGAVVAGKFGYFLDKMQTAYPYAVALGFFALMTVVAGRLQDKLGPRVISTIGGLFLGAGLFVCSLAKPGDPSTGMYLLVGFGILGGMGIGMGYACALPPAIKWFPASKKGLISGVVVGGFGISSAYVSPLSTYLITSKGPQYAFQVLAVVFAIGVVIFSQFLKNPPAGYVPAGAVPAPGKAKAAAPAVKSDYTPGEMASTWQFYAIWFMYLFAAGAGLMVIGFIATLAKKLDLMLMVSYGVTILAVGNCSGRIICGVLSDKIGRLRTMLIVFVLQAVIMYLFSNPAFQRTGVFAACAFMIGFNFGSCLSLFPSLTADYFGLKNLGMNYGMVFTAYGAGGVVMTLLAGKIPFNQAILIGAALCLISAALTFVVKPPAAKALAATSAKKA